MNKINDYDPKYLDDYDIKYRCSECNTKLKGGYIQNTEKRTLDIDVEPCPKCVEKNRGPYS